eukprot:5351796-Amphidinium_carterae.1
MHCQSNAWQCGVLLLEQCIVVLSIHAHEALSAQLGAYYSVPSTIDKATEPVQQTKRRQGEVIFHHNSTEVFNCDGLSVALFLSPLMG